MRRTQPLSALFRGLNVTLMTVPSFLILNVLCAHLIHPFLPKNPNGSVEMIPQLLSGAASAIISQAVVFPLDTIRRQMQVSTLKPPGSLTSLRITAQYIINNRGVAALYAGLWPATLKVAPSVAISFVVFDMLATTFAIKN
eukprot:TRINITY_DN10590_c0_g1_i1.p1 TRINITY_DN10590_c0_g1~~TRINITY_DN10590_c0_g1_i1.p1  ORF type:complete len:141 (+),score=11.38 TRINITY_DN10590_c0_g1_i1:144-566(+)